MRMITYASKKIVTNILLTDRFAIVFFGLDFPRTVHCFDCSLVTHLAETFLIPKYLCKMLSTRSLEMPVASAILRIVTRRSLIIISWILSTISSVVTPFQTFKFRCLIFNYWYRRCRVPVNSFQFCVIATVHFNSQKQVITAQYSILISFVKM